MFNLVNSYENPMETLGKSHGNPLSDGKDWLRLSCMLVTLLFRVNDLIIVHDDIKNGQ